MAERPAGSPQTSVKTRGRMNAMFKQLRSVDFELNLLIQMAVAWNDTELLSAVKRAKFALQKNVPREYHGAFNEIVKPLPTEDA